MYLIDTNIWLWMVENPSNIPDKMVKIVKDANNYRINVIGFTNKSKIETNIKIKKTQISKRFSVDKKGQVYRVEYYNDKKFAGMVLVKFKS